MMRRSILLLFTVCASSLAGLAEDATFGLDSWAGRKAHLAVVNPAVPVADGSVLSLRGEWEFAAFRPALEARDLGYHRDRDFWGRASAVWKDARKILVPGCWEAQGVGEEGPGVGYNGRTDPCCVRLRHAHVGNGFYRKRVTIPSAWTGKRIWLKVGQARNRAWAWIDDKPVAHFCEPYRALKWEITDLVTPGRECVVKFQVDNAFVGYRNSGTMAYHRWGGLVRDVELEATPETFIDEAWARGDFDTRCAQVKVEIAGKREEGRGNRLRVTVEDETKEMVLRSTPTPSTYTLEVPLKSFRPWSPEHPNLHTAKVELVSADGAVLQTRFERFGVRKLEVRGKELYLNGKPFFVRGFGDDCTYPLTGVSPASRAFHLAHLRLARSAGFNFVRTHTHCEIPEYFEAADEAGVLVQSELSYNCDESSCETFAFDPVGDAKAIWEGYRRHPSFAVYSGGNEGTLGAAGKALFDWVHANDPDRLVVEQDGGTYLEGHRADKSDFASGPMAMWERGSFNPRAFICHEYGNLAVKGDARTEGDYTGVWLPRLTRAMRRENLVAAGLGDAWGDRLQDAQHAFQRLWTVRSVEAARKDPFCDGYVFWTIVDFLHFDRGMNAPNAQGLLDPFWRVKPRGTTPADLAAVNAESAILLDTEGRVRDYRENADPMLCCGSLNRLVIDETNRVFAAGETIPAEFILSHYGERTIAGAQLRWTLEADGRTLAEGVKVLGDCAAGPARTVAGFGIAVPEVGRPVRAVLCAVVTGQDGRPIANAWDFWLFPRRSAPVVPPDVVVADLGSTEAETARKAGKSILLVGNRKGAWDIFPGWWMTTLRDPELTQNGLAAVPHAVFGKFPFEPFLSPLLFRLIGQGTPLPVAGFEEKDFVMVGEGNTDFKLYLAAKTRPDGGREVFVSGLDVFGDGVEARTLLQGIFDYLGKRSDDAAALERAPWIGDGRPVREGADWYKDDPAPIFTAKFVLPKDVTNAVVRLATPDCCFLTVNGETPFAMPVGVIPQWSPYDKTIYAETFTFPRVKSHPATNEVALLLGNGWYNMPPLKFWGGIPFREHLPHGRPCFKLAVDGVGPLDWTWQESPLVQNSYQLGEVWDLRRPEDKAPKKAVAVAGPKGKVVPARAPTIGPLLVQGTSGKSRWLKKGEVQVIDFDVNLTAVYAFKLDGAGLKSGDRIEIIYGERLNADGSVNPLTQTAGQIKRAGVGGPGSPDVAMQRDVVIADGRQKDLFFNNAVTWHVARYVEIRGCRKLLKPDGAVRMPIGSRVEPIEPGASFKSKTDELNGVHEICYRTFLSNLVGVQSDCPGRERLGYGGDIVATCEAMMLNFDMKEFYLKTLQDFADEAANDGWITETAPYVGIADHGFGGRSGPISWTLVVPVLMDGIIRHYPDAKDRALGFYPVCTRYIALVDAANPSGIIPKCIGDHEALERAPDEVTATAHWHEFVRLTAKFAAMLGKADEQARLEALATKVEKAFQAKFVKDGVVANGTQSAQAIGLYLGLVPPDQVKAAEARLVKAVEEKDCGPTTGIFSTRYMLMYLAEHGRNDLARKIVLHRGFPGWLHMLERGATTLWETWKESDDVYSNCHPMFGSVDEWILRFGGRDR